MRRGADLFEIRQGICTRQIIDPHSQRQKRKAFLCSLIQALILKCYCRTTTVYIRQFRVANCSGLLSSCAKQFPIRECVIHSWNEPIPFMVSASSLASGMCGLFQCNLQASETRHSSHAWRRIETPFRGIPRNEERTHSWISLCY